jgi:hypothetical protein
VGAHQLRGAVKRLPWAAPPAERGPCARDPRPEAVRGSA